MEDQRFQLIMDAFINYIHSLSAEYGLIAVGIADPKEFVLEDLSWASTAICFALSYPHSRLNRSVPAGTGIVASYSMGPDYHKVLSHRLEQLVNHIRITFPGKYTIHVDDPRIFERALALRTGMGWIGANQCLFLPDYGSYVVLGEILTNLECIIHPKQRTPLCGNCKLCIDTCPTGALSGDGSFNRDRCISHLTQSRGQLSLDLMPLIGNHIYGCDVCQAICPQNQSDSQVDEEMGVACYPGPNPYLRDILNLSSEQWSQGIQNTSIGWIGRNTWRRNAIIAAANTNITDCKLQIRQACSDTSPVVSYTAKWAIAHMCAYSNIP